MSAQPNERRPLRVVVERGARGEADLLSCGHREPPSRGGAAYVMPPKRRRCSTCPVELPIEGDGP